MPEVDPQLLQLVTEITEMKLPTREINKQLSIMQLQDSSERVGTIAAEVVTQMGQLLRCMPAHNLMYHKNFYPGGKQWIDWVRQDPRFATITLCAHQKAELNFITQALDTPMIGEHIRVNRESFSMIREAWTAYEEREGVSDEYGASIGITDAILRAAVQKYLLDKQMVLPEEEEDQLVVQLFRALS